MQGIWTRAGTIFALGVVVAGCGDAKKSFEENFEKSFHENLVSSCTSSALGAGVTQDLANKMCTCASDKVKERFSVVEKMNLKQEQLKPIVAECANALG